MLKLLWPLPETGPLLFKVEGTRETINNKRIASDGIPLRMGKPMERRCTSAWYEITDTEAMALKKDLEETQETGYESALSERMADV